VSSAATMAKSPLPDLRQDLRLIGRAQDLAGNTLWKIYDPVRHRYTALSQRDYALLDVWLSSDSSEDIVADVWNKHAEIVTLEDVDSFSHFLISNGLALPSGTDVWRHAFTAQERHRSKHLTRLLHTYLFFRIPLLQPEPLLNHTLPFVRWLGCWSTIYGLMCLALVGMFLVSREWDRFLASAADLATVTGAASVVAAIAIVKVFHELGHGYTAVHFRCRVPSAGVAVILGAPLLYVDVTDSWKLESRRARMIIDCAGIVVDFSISILAMLLWVFLPDGTLRNAAFSFATAGWVTSLIFNLNPFMKFDGYHILVDALSLPNLQERSLSLARWQFREILFGLRLATPERVKNKLRYAMIVYGTGVWLYRVIMFTGIAIAVYNYFFKALGILLFVVEIGYFIAWPLLSELKEWVAMRKIIYRSNRARLSFFFILGLVAILVYPWSVRVNVPAVLEPVQIIPLYVSVASKTVSNMAAHGASVSSGELLVQLSSRTLEQELTLARLRADIVDLRLARLAGDPTERESAIVLERERLSLEHTIGGIQKRITELRIVAPSDGVITSLVPHLSAGRWITTSEPVAVVVKSGGARVRGLVEAADRPRLQPGMRAKFIPNDLQQGSINCILTSVAGSNTSILDQPELASSFGGVVPTRLSKGGKAAPSETQYAVLASFDDLSTSQSASPSQPQVGLLVVEGLQQSFMLRFWNRVLVVLMRESGF
jgi:putative peptide zinc metalloprotease protein